jgi:hypothetical protein
VRGLFVSIKVCHNLLGEVLRKQFVGVPHGNDWFTTLTLKSTHTMLSQRIDEGRLIPWTPMMEGEPCVRTLFISDKINELFDPEQWNDPSLGVRYAQLSVDFDHFVTGQMLAVGWEPYEKGENAFMARIDPEESGIWSMRSCAPLPSIRVLGAFYGADVFVALIARRRSELDGPRGRKWSNAKEYTMAMWDDLLPNKERMIGEDLNDFITEKKTIV